ncbi:MAG: hypothetical protein V3U03_08040 [Myxococcota bacterium]
MAEYVDVEKAKDLPGLRLVLSVGVPGPWGEAAKGVFHVKRVPFVRVRQDPGLPNEELERWTGHANAPLAIYADERPRSAWSEIVLLAERLAPESPLLPSDPERRALTFGYLHELAGEMGLGWCRRLTLLHEVLSLPPERAGAAREIVERLGQRYGYHPAAAEAAPRRAAEILRLFSERLRRQRERGSRFLVGAELSALDIYWAAFAALVEPLPPELCPMPEFLRRQYSASDPIVRGAADPLLLEHRDFIYREYLELPVDL